MIINLKLFYEKTDTNYEDYNKLWEENKEQFIFLHTNLPLSKQITSIINDISDNKDILVVRFPNVNIFKNKIIKNIILGKGFIYDNNKIWYPKEVWIYNPLS